MKKLFVGILMVCLVVGFGFVYAGGFPILGATYQLDRARFPGEIAICCTEDAMHKYWEAKWEGNESMMEEMLFKIKTWDDITKMRKAEGCMLICSCSQAEIIEKGVYGAYIRAHFFACPLKSMWGYYMYFGGRVK